MAEIFNKSGGSMRPLSASVSIKIRRTLVSSRLMLDLMVGS